jgi:hypothetical protein
LPAGRRGPGSQIESRDVSTQDVLSRFVAALGGTLKLIADFGDEQLKLVLGVRQRQWPAISGLPKRAT